MKQIIKNIIKRINNPICHLYIYDPMDKSEIVIDDELLIVIKRYYENKLLKERY